MTSKCGHRGHLAAPLVPRFCSYHILTPSVKETIYLAPIPAFFLFWSVPSVLVSQTERNSRGHDSSGIVKKRVRFGSGREIKKLISQHDPPLPFFSDLCYSSAVQYGIAFYQVNARNSLCLFSHTHMLLFHCLQFVPRRQFLSQAAAK